MRPLADFIMRGRTQALLVTVISVFSGYFYWIGAAAIGLVTLRKGLQEGLVILLWACLPAGALWYQFGAMPPLLVMLSTLIAATQLRWSGSWQAALVSASVTGLLTSILLMALGGEFLDSLADVYNEAFAQAQSVWAQQGETRDAWLTSLKFDRILIAGLFGVTQTFATIISMIIARWWQSMLYNPGGFRTEFHGLRLNPALAALLNIVALGISFTGSNYALWAMIIAAPVLFAGIALIHGTLALRGIGAGWLVIFYVLLPRPEMVIVLCALALLDSLLDFRSRITGSVLTKKGEQGHDKPDDDDKDDSDSHGQ